MTWNKLTDTGDPGLGEDIKLIANIQVEKLVEAVVLKTNYTNIEYDWLRQKPGPFAFYGLSSVSTVAWLCP